MSASVTAYADQQAVFVTVTVPKDKINEFLAVMTIDVSESRKEEGCLRFDLLKGDEKEDGTVFHFYEVYVNADAAALHKTLPHYKKWADFKAVNMDTVGASQTVVKCVGAMPF